MEKNDVTSSISFVINAIYTFTFGNTALLLLTNPGASGFSLETIDITVTSAVCGLIAMTITIRYFFGNNLFIADIFTDDSKGEYVRLFHFFTVAIQSVLLLFASYEVRNETRFFTFLAALFFLEFAWFSLCHLFDKRSVAETGNFAPTRDWAYQGFGLLVVFLIAIFASTGSKIGTFEMLLVAGLFAVDTVFDMRSNLKGYMGVK